EPGAENLSGMKQEEAKVEDCDEGNMDDVWDITQEEPDNDIDSILTQVPDGLLEEFRDEILDITLVDEEADFNPTKDIEELERLIGIDHESSFTKIKAFSCIITTNVEFEPFIQQLNPLPRVSQSSKSSTKMSKKRREITSPPWSDIYPGPGRIYPGVGRIYSGAGRIYI
ncbi:hypothetical protein Tco_1149434, partial [Tanacetum coccineum]